MGAADPRNVRFSPEADVGCNACFQVTIDVCLHNASVHACIWPRFHWFGYDVWYRQKIRSSIQVSAPGGSSFSPEPRSEDAARNSAKLPCRLAFRSHPSAATITVVRPYLAISCGP